MGLHPASRMPLHPCITAAPYITAALRRSPFGTLLKTWVLRFPGTPKCGEYSTSPRKNPCCFLRKKLKTAFSPKRESRYSLRHPPPTHPATPAETCKMSIRKENHNPGTPKRIQCSGRLQQVVEFYWQARENRNKRFGPPPGALISHRYLQYLEACGPKRQRRRTRRATKNQASRLSFRMGAAEKVSFGLRSPLYGDPNNYEKSSRFSLNYL